MVRKLNRRLCALHFSGAFHLSPDCLRDKNSHPVIAYARGLAAAFGNMRTACKADIALLFAKLVRLLQLKGGGNPEKGEGPQERAGVTGLMDAIIEESFVLWTSLGQQETLSEPCMIALYHITDSMGKQAYIKNMHNYPMRFQSSTAQMSDFLINTIQQKGQQARQQSHKR